MRFLRGLLILAAMLLLVILLYQVPAINSRLGWRLLAAEAYLRGVVNPIGEVPTPLARSTVQLPTAFPTSTQAPSTPVDSPPTPSPSPTMLPASVSLPSPQYEQQDWNSCGPAALTMYLRYYGWDGDQFAISQVVKPEREDRNVNPEELLYYTRNYAGWLNATFRVGGDLQLLKAFIAAGIPVMVESVFEFDDPYWPGDDLWAAHYLLLTGYDDASAAFTTQDTFRGPDRQVGYAQLDADWKPFNRVYMLVYTPEQEQTVQAILGPHWDLDANRQAALEAAQAETQADPQDAFAWFNLGSNYLYLEDYQAAAQAYDTARTLGLPQRMLRYQFGPFIAYFHTLRTEDLLALTDYALQVTYRSEEAWLWRGWALYRQGDGAGATEAFREAYWQNPLSLDAQYALEFIGAEP